MLNSLRGRLLIAASLILIVFLGLTGFILDRAYEQSARVSQLARLEAEARDLLRIADPGLTNALVIPGDATDHRLMIPHSGLYAQVTNEEGLLVWTSPSMIATYIPFDTQLSPAEQSFSEVKTNNGQELFVLSLGVIWEDGAGKDRGYTFSVAESKTFFSSQVNEFRSALWFWLGGLVIVLLVVQWGILNWGLKPLRWLARDVREIEEGLKEYLSGHYPQELQGLSRNLNALVKHERQRQERYRHAMADLAHSLKTPLAVLRSVVEGRDGAAQSHAVIEQQVDRLDQIARYQLQRAATAGKSTFTKPIRLLTHVDNVISALQKVYHDKHVNITKECASNCLFYGDEADLIEVVGNLLDNACKYGDGNIRFVAQMKHDEQNAVVGLHIEVTNDGAAIPEEQICQVMQRGVRADSKKEGQGIGLAMVNDIIKAYDGDIQIRSQEGTGTTVEVFFPR